MTERFTALVPMKAHSERVKNKNIRDLCGKPLFYYILETLQDCEKIGDIVVDTDSDFIKEKLNFDFEDIIVLDRPEELRDGDIPMNSIIAHDLKQTSEEYFLQTHSTNPLLKAQTIDKSIDLFLSFKNHDSLFSVNSIQTRCYDSTGAPINHDLRIMERTQDLTPIYEENSCIFLFTRKSFNQENNRIGKTPYLFEIDNEEALDIDDEFDFELVQSVLQIRKKGI